MKLQHGHTYRTRCGWVGRVDQINGAIYVLRGNDVPVTGQYGTSGTWWYLEDGMFNGQQHDPDFPMHIVEEVFDNARASLIESLRGIAESWHEPLAKANMLAMLEIIDELKGQHE